MKRLYQTICCALMISILVAGCASTGKVRELKKADEDLLATAIKQMAEDTTVNIDPKGLPEEYVKQQFEYLMAWNGIPVGYIHAEIGEIIDYKEWKVRVVRLRTESNKYLSKIYRVEDNYTSYVDVKTGVSRYYEADRREGNYRKHVVVEYDFTKLEATYTSITDSSVKKCKIREDVQDPLSTILQFMKLPIKVGEEVLIVVNLNEKNYDLFAKIEKLDKIKLPRLGSFTGFRVRPYALHKGEEYKRGSGYLYFDTSRKRWPLYGVVWIPFGKVTATLRSVEEIFVEG